MITISYKLFFLLDKIITTSQIIYLKRDKLFKLNYIGLLHHLDAASESSADSETGTLSCGGSHRGDESV